MTGRRKRYSAEFKARVALDARRGELTVVQLATKHGIHQTMGGEWKKPAMEGVAAVFSGGEAAQDGARSSEAEVERLHAKIGQLGAERDFWRKPPVDEPGRRRQVIERRSIPVWTSPTCQYGAGSSSLWR